MISDERLFFIAGGGMLVGGTLAGLLFGPSLVTNSPLVALALAVAVAGAGAVLLNKVV
jgi:hypothetical protein